jgi:ACR3 family arsenite efflux pump ArsB
MGYRRLGYAIRYQEGEARLHAKFENQEYWGLLLLLIISFWIQARNLVTRLCNVITCVGFGTLGLLVCRAIESFKLSVDRGGLVCMWSRSM